MIAFTLISLISCNKENLQPIPSQENHFNHEIFEENKLAPRATFFVFEDVNVSEKEKSSRFLSLNGQWKFHWTKNPKNRPTTFHHLDYDDSDWDQIPVPANWETEGFGHPIYLDERYPFSTTWPNVPEDYNPVGTYRKIVILDKNFLKEDVILHFEAIKAAYIYVNGQYAGYSQGSKTTAEFDITPYLQEGKNLIALQLFRWTDASYLESQDMLRMSGIERDVYLYTRPKVFIQDYHAKTTLDDSYRNGIFNSEVIVQNNTMDGISKPITLEISDG